MRSTTEAGEGGGTGAGAHPHASETTSEIDGPIACQITPDDHVCTECRKTNCCEQYEACIDDEACLCWWECLVTDGMSSHCAEVCASEGAVYLELNACTEAQCAVCSR